MGHSQVSLNECNVFEVVHNCRITHLSGPLVLVSLLLPVPDGSDQVSISNNVWKLKLPGWVNLVQMKYGVGSPFSAGGGGVFRSSWY